MSDAIKVTNLRYREITQQIEDWIDSGNYRPGDRLPTWVDLMAHFSASRATVGRAIDELEAMGRVVARRGAGTFVAASTPAVPAAKSFAFLVPWISSVEALPYVEGRIHGHIAGLVGQSGSALKLQTARPSREGAGSEVLEASEILVRSGVDGVFFYPAELPVDQSHWNLRAAERLANAGVPVVLLDRDVVPYPQRSAFSRIGFDNRSAAARLTEHLIQAGAERIVFVGIEEESTAVADRIAGFLDCMRVHGRDADQSVVLTPGEPESGLGRHILDRYRPDAILCKSDRFAALLGNDLQAEGVSIGTDIMLAGFDDDPIAELLPVPLTSARLPARILADEAFNEMMRRIDDPSRPPIQVVVDPTVIPRASTCGGRGDS